MGVEHSTVVNIHHARETRPKLPTTVSEKLGDTQVYRIATLPQEAQEPIATAVAEADLTEPERGRSSRQRGRVASMPGSSK